MRLDCFSHSITMEVWKPARWKTAKFHRNEHTPACICSCIFFGINPHVSKRHAFRLDRVTVITADNFIRLCWGVLVLLVSVQIHGALIAFLIALQWKCEKLLGEKQPNFTETSTPQFLYLIFDIDQWGVKSYGFCIRLKMIREFRKLYNRQEKQSRRTRICTQISKTSTPPPQKVKFK